MPYMSRMKCALRLRVALVLGLLALLVVTLAGFGALPGGAMASRGAQGLRLISLSIFTDARFRFIAESRPR